MTNPPFGFSNSEGDEPSDESAVDPFAALGGMPDLGAMLQQLGSMMSGESGPVNWQVARTSAMAVIGADAGTTGNRHDRGCRRDPARRRLAQPGDRAAIRRDLGGSVEPPPLAGGDPTGVDRAGRAGRGPGVRRDGRGAARGDARMAAPLMGMMSQIGGLIFGGQVGQALGTLATEVVARARSACRSARPGSPRCCPSRCARSARASTSRLEEVRLFVALREAAHHRLFGHVPWLRGHLLAAVRSYAEGIVVDTSRFEELARGSTRPTPRRCSARSATGCSSRPPRPRKRPRWPGSRPPSRWSRAGSTRSRRRPAQRTLPSFAALQETMRRRRATGGPAETHLRVAGRARAAAAAAARGRHALAGPGRAARHRRP